MKIRLREIKVVNLNSKTVILLTQFVRMARLNDGADLKMQYPDIVHRVFLHADMTNNPDLIVLFMRIRQHLVNCVTNSGVENPSFNVYHNVA